MKLHINDISNEVLEDYTNTIEDYFEIDQNEIVLRVYDIVCRQISELNLAKFSIIFSEWDACFTNADIYYDFSSIAYELPDLKLFIEKGKGSFFLHFFELDRNIEFVKNKNKFTFTIRETLGNQKIVEGILDITEFYIMIQDLIKQFKELLQNYFPIAFSLFVQNQFCV